MVYAVRRQPGDRPWKPSALELSPSAQACGSTPCGITSAVGLLAPKARLAAGYRRYGERRIAELERVQAGLSHLIAACPGHGRAMDCPILKALGAEDSHE